jgi:hypothetical protein
MAVVMAVVWSAVTGIVATEQMEDGCWDVVDIWYFGIGHGWDAESWSVDDADKSAY